LFLTWLALLPLAVVPAAADWKNPNV